MFPAPQKTLKCDVIAPSILTKDKIDQNPFLLNKYNIKNKIFHFIYFSSFSIANLVTFVKKIIDRILPNSNKKIKSDTYIYAAHGSFIVLCKSFFSKGGYVDNNFFLYAEESTLAEIAKKINAKILYSPDIVVNHEARG